jgi:hypothetical protein
MLKTSGSFLQTFPLVRHCVNLYTLETVASLRQLTLETVWVKLLLVGALGQWDDARGAPVPASALRPADKVAHVVLGGGELPVRVTGVVVLAVHPVGVDPPVLVGELVGN